MYLPRKKDDETVVVMATDREELNSTELRLLSLLNPREATLSARLCLTGLPLGRTTNPQISGNCLGLP